MVLKKSTKAGKQGLCESCGPVCPVCKNIRINKYKTCYKFKDLTECLICKKWFQTNKNNFLNCDSCTDEKYFTYINKDKNIFIFKEEYGYLTRGLNSEYIDLISPIRSQKYNGGYFFTKIKDLDDLFKKIEKINKIIRKLT